MERLIKERWFEAAKELLSNQISILSKTKWIFHFRIANILGNKEF